MKKKFIATLLTMSLLASLCACGGADETPTDDNSSYENEFEFEEWNSDDVKEENPKPTKAESKPTSTPTPEPTATSTPTPELTPEVEDVRTEKEITRFNEMIEDAKEVLSANEIVVPYGDSVEVAFWELDASEKYFQKPDSYLWSYIDYEVTDDLLWVELKIEPRESMLRALNDIDVYDRDYSINGTLKQVLVNGEVVDYDLISAFKDKYLYPETIKCDIENRVASGNIWSVPLYIEDTYDTVDFVYNCEFVLDGKSYEKDVIIPVYSSADTISKIGGYDDAIGYRYTLWIYAYAWRNTNPTPGEWFCGGTYDSTEHCGLGNVEWRLTNISIDEVSVSEFIDGMIGKNTIKDVSSQISESSYARHLWKQYLDAWVEEVGDEVLSTEIDQAGKFVIDDEIPGLKIIEVQNKADFIQLEYSTSRYVDDFIVSTKLNDSIDNINRCHDLSGAVYYSEDFGSDNNKTFGHLQQQEYNFYLKHDEEQYHSFSYRDYFFVPEEVWENNKLQFQQAIYVAYEDANGDSVRNRDFMSYYFDKETVK